MKHSEWCLYELGICTCTKQGYIKEVGELYKWHVKKQNKLARKLTHRLQSIIDKYKNEQT